MLIFLSFGTPILLIYQMEAVGYITLPFFCACCFLIAYSLAASSGQTTWRRRVLLYGLWGLIAGVALWAHLVVAPYILVSGLLLVVCCWRELLKWAVWPALLGLLIGIWPLISYNLHAAPGENSFSTFSQLSQFGSDHHYTLKTQLIMPMITAVPTTLGLAPSCFISSTPLLHNSQPHALRCLTLQVTWGFGFLLLLIIALLLASVALLHFWRTRTADHEGLISRQQALARHSARLLLSLGGLITLLFFIRNPTAVYTGTLGARYVICILVSLPAVFCPFWYSIEIVRSRLLYSTLFFTRIAFVVIICFFSLTAMLDAFQHTAQEQTTYRKLLTLEDQLERMHITRFYSEYWTCNPLIFASREKLICGDTYDNLSHGFDRYLPYRVMVQAEPNPAFVYPLGAHQITTLENLLKTTNTPYQRVEVAGYVIYQPVSPIPNLHF